MTNEEFIQIIIRLKNNDIQALKRIYEEYFQKIEYTAMSIVKNESDAYDVAMDVMMRLVSYPSDPMLIKNHIALLLVITKNTAINYIKKRSRNFSLDKSVEDLAISNDTNPVWFYNIVDLMTTEEKDIFIRHCIWGTRLKQIAKEKGVSYRTIVRIYSNIKRKIKELYE